MLTNALFTPWGAWSVWPLNILRILAFWGIVMLVIRLHVRRYSKIQRFAQMVYAVTLLLVMIVDGNRHQPLSLLTFLFNTSLIFWTIGALRDIGSRNRFIN